MRAGERRAGAAPRLYWLGRTCWKGAVVEGRLLLPGPVKVFAGCCAQEQSEQLVELQDGPRPRGRRQQADHHPLHLNQSTSFSLRAALAAPFPFKTALIQVFSL